MSIMVTEVYQALVDAGASEEKARAAAEAIPDMSDLAEKNDVAELRSELKQDIADLRAELNQDIAELRSELKQDIAELRSELKQDIAELRSELKQDIVGLKADLYKHMWLMQGATILAIVGILKLLP
jgi:DNA anti-recombination protein RmuC